ncbi:hypothetical protein PISMIDRAFT_683618 [Pisolithus microcarpus 441]|uniref:Uncharacterized protein n=1 Tax=Pisolithus microcarpus 441 TaxID=765257 RepID=A0A0C9YQR5_9AGAM|nr:hypothetical protein PISMIDRAFT_683618 [Pisolithus microcarpus 441]
MRIRKESGLESIHRRDSFRLLVIRVTDGIASVVISRREKRTEKGPKVGSSYMSVALLCASKVKSEEGMRVDHAVIGPKIYNEC